MKTPQTKFDEKVLFITPSNRWWKRIRQSCLDTWKGNIRPRLVTTATMLPHILPQILGGSRLEHLNDERELLALVVCWLQVSSSI